MIKVIRIAGESFDFETKKETPKALILSNGKTEFSLYVDDAVAEALVMMMLEADAVPVVPAKPNGSAAKHATPTPAPKAPVSRPKPEQQMAVVSHDEIDLSDDNSGFEPGEAYNDPSTGAESL